MSLHETYDRERDLALWRQRKSKLLTPTVRYAVNMRTARQPNLLGDDRFQVRGVAFLLDNDIDEDRLIGVFASLEDAEKFIQENKL